jgi:HD-GYP domain-containing protein (c-di-GMP phosphodiesterase class II)
MADGETVGDPIPAVHMRLPAWRRLGWRLGASFLLLTTLALFLSSVLQYRAQERWLRESLGGLLLNVARTGALLVDPALHAEVEAGRATDTVAYRRLRAALAAVQDANGIGTPIYTLTDFDAAARRARFMVTSRGPGAPGEPYPLVPALIGPLDRAFREGVAAHTGIYRNQSGTWITAFAPVRDGAGRVFAVLDVDYPVDVYLAELARIRRNFSLGALAAGLVAVVAGTVLARRITGPVAQLAALARRVVEGDLTARVRVRSRDEIGMLGNVFHLMVERLAVSHRSLVDVLVRALEARGAEAGSLRRVAGAALAIGEGLALTPAQREALELGALLHDIGEIRTPEAVLQKPGPLTPDERRLVEQHPGQGVDLLEAVPLLTPALDVVGAHHERWDGTGYPNGLREEAIPLVARIFAVADALDAMTHDRPHRTARSLEEALGAIRDEAGKQFDPRVCEVALAIAPARWGALLGVT